MGLNPCVLEQSRMQLTLSPQGLQATLARDDLLQARPMLLCNCVVSTELLCIIASTHQYTSVHIHF